MGSEPDWQTWFANYSTFILHYARLAQKLRVEALCVGMELHQTEVQRESDCRVMSEIRRVYDEKLVYGANWYQEFEEIQFWDALDYIGIQAYFPLADQITPGFERLRSGWSNHISSIEQVQKAFNKPVLITELGYHSSVNAAIEPWVWRAEARDPSPQDRLQSQVDCYEAFFQTFWDQPWFAGVYIWKWYPQHQNRGGTLDTDFTPQNKTAQQTMADWFRKNLVRPDSTGSTHISNPR